MALPCPGPPAPEDRLASLDANARRWMWASSPPEAGANASRRTKILNFIGFDSSRIFHLQGWNFQAPREFPGSLSQRILVWRLLARRLAVSDGDPTAALGNRASQKGRPGGESAALRSWARGRAVRIRRAQAFCCLLLFSARILPSYRGALALTLLLWSEKWRDRWRGAARRGSARPRGVSAPAHRARPHGRRGHCVGREARGGPLRHLLPAPRQRERGKARPERTLPAQAPVP